MWEESERAKEREKRSIHINTKSAKNPRPKNNAKQTISHLHFPSLFFSRLFQSDDDKISHFETHQRNLNRKERRYLIFHHSCWACILYFSTKETYTTVLLLHNKWFYVFHIFFGVCIRKRSTPRVWWSSVSVVLTPRWLCAKR